MKTPIVSVVIPAYNAADYIGEAIESALAQDAGVPVEIVVVDDGSTDGTCDVVRRFPSVRLIRQRNGGPSVARNAGVNAARGDYVAFLDADDLWAPEKLSKQLEVFAREKSCVVFGDQLTIDADGSPVGDSLFASTALAPNGDQVYGVLEGAYDRLLTCNYLPTSSVLVNRALLKKVGGFDPRFRYVEDLDLWLRLALVAELFFVPEVVVYKRHHGANVSSNLIKMKESYIAVIEKHQGFEWNQSKARKTLFWGILCHEHRSLGEFYLDLGDLQKARACFWRSLRLKFQIKTLLYWSLTIPVLSGGLMLRRGMGKVSRVAGGNSVSHS